MPSSSLSNRIRQFRRLIHDPRATRADLLTFAVLAFAIPDREGCHPSEATLATSSRQDRKTVRASIRRLTGLEAVTFERRQAGGRIVGTIYRFPASPTMEESAPHGGGVDTPPPALDGGIGRARMGEMAPAINPDSAIRTGPDSGVIDLEAEQLARQVQQASIGPWRLINARQAVRAAIARAGIEVVRQLAVQLTGAGLRAYEISARLAALRAPEAAQPTRTGDQVQPAPATTDTPPSPVVRRALALISADDPTTKLRWHRRAAEAGITAPAPALRAWVPAIAVDYLATEHWREWHRLQAAEAV